MARGAFEPDSYDCYPEIEPVCKETSRPCLAGHTANPGHEDGPARPKHLNFGLSPARARARL